LRYEKAKRRGRAALHTLRDKATSTEPDHSLFPCQRKTSNAWRVTSVIEPRKISLTKTGVFSWGLASFCKLIYLKLNS
jgi:hypothetical protein